MWNFENKTYLVTGANSGMGKCVSELLLSCGARIFMVDRDIDNMEKLHKSNPTESDYIQFDLNKPNEISSIFEKAKKTGFVFDGLVYCAGISPLMTLKDFDLELFKTTFNINVVSFVAMLKFFMEDEYTNANSSIVGISSNASVYGGNRQYAYSASKSAMNLVVKSIVKELAQRKTRVNTVMPSTTNTEMVEKLRKQSDAIDLNVKYKMPFGILNPDDIAKTIMFLLSDDSLAISGITMPVNNGEVY